MSDQPDVYESNTIGARLKAAREARGLTLDDVANKTRVPIRHLKHIEAGDWDSLPAPTYSVGFARSYANAVGLNGTEIGAELRSELGGSRIPASAAPYYEAADPARVPPRSLAIVAGVIAILLAVGYMIWRSGTVDDTAVEQAEIAAVDAPIAAAPAAAPAAGTVQPAPATGPVVLTASDDVWLRVSEAGGPKLFEKILKAGERYEVPATARQPQITTGRPDSLRVTVGATAIPPLGPPQRTISDVSLLPNDLVARLQPAAAGPSPTAAPAQQPPNR
ncbi:MAG TPA: RodZ domain-containing protein [Allosphingosinicella sp.]|jgi:cytoskeleton protein RodZ